MRHLRARLADGTFYYGWVVVVACFLAAGVVFGMTFSFGVFLDPLAVQFSASSARTSLVFSVQLFVLYTGAAPMGSLVEWIGPRKGLLLAAALLGGGMAAASQVDSLLLVILTYSLLTGMGMSLAYVVGYATPPQWFKRRRGMATAFASAGLGVGMIIISPMASYLVTWVGWRGTFLLLGAGLAFILFLASLLIPDDPAHVDAGFESEFPDGRPASEGGWREQVEFVRVAVRSRGFLLLFGGYVLLYMCLFVLLNHLVSFAAEQGIRQIGVFALSVLGGTTAVTRLAVGGVADRLGRVTVFGICGAVLAVGLIVLPFARTPPVLLSLAVFCGVGYGGTGALMSSVPADLFGGQNLNTLFGLISISLGVSGLLGPFAAGLGFDILGTYTPVFVATGIVGLVGIGLVRGATVLQEEIGGPS